MTFGLRAGAAYTTVAGGLSGIAKTTRYWDCCKPSSSWNRTYRKTAVRSCAADGVTTVDVNTQSGCNSGGAAFACTDNSPWVINNTGYGFIATGFSTEPRTSCKCFMLGLPNNNTMIVQSINIGGDLGTNQIDMMVCPACSCDNLQLTWAHGLISIAPVLVASYVCAATCKTAMIFSML